MKTKGKSKMRTGGKGLPMRPAFQAGMERGMGGKPKPKGKRKI
jgi:hypothetical protein